MQIRLDSEEKRKYRWLASTHYRRGTRSGTHVHVTGNLDSDTAYVTEGGLKGDVASFLDDEALFVFVAGISAIQGLNDILSTLNIRRIIVAVDMDKLSNEKVLKDLTKMTRELKHLRDVRIDIANWEPEFNGIDDYYYARNTTSTMLLELMAA